MRSDECNIPLDEHKSMLQYFLKLEISVSLQDEARCLNQKQDTKSRKQIKEKIKINGNTLKHSLLPLMSSHFLSQTYHFSFGFQPLPPGFSCFSLSMS